MPTDFQDLTDVKSFIKDIAEHLPTHSPYRGDFEFFSSINCTTQSEYRHELKSFLEVFIAENTILTMPDTVRLCYSRLLKLYDWL